MNLPEALPNRTVQMGPLSFQISTAIPGLLERLAQAYPGFIVPPLPQPEVRLEVSIDPILQPTGLGNIQLRLENEDLLYATTGSQGRLAPGGAACLAVAASHAYFETDLFLRVVLGFVALRRGGVLLHASGVVEAGRAYLFFGHSGNGKTTSARLSAPRQVLNDDAVLLLPDPAAAGFVAYGTPFTNPSQVPPSPGQAPLAGMFRLVKDPEMFILPMSPAAALAELTSCVPLLAALPQQMPQVIAVLAQVTRDIQRGYLHFRKDASFWQHIAH